MAIDSVVSSSARWLWTQFGKDFTATVLGRAREQWAKFHWKDAEEKYRTRLREQHRMTRLLGHPKPIAIDDIFTDVYVLDKPTAFKRFDLTELQSRPIEREALRLHENRKPALRLALKHKRLFILGKPGSGKTTFLKYLTLKACSGIIRKTPIFVSLKEWADSGLDLMPFLIQEFEVCAFPDAQRFIKYLLEKGNALVLFDGLDEVNQESNQRAKMISVLTRFAKSYPDTHICLTCRIAATDYSFEEFTYIEVADFNEQQMRLFAEKWYQSDKAAYNRFLVEFDSPANEGLRELAHTPLLLALLCLAFDETLSFPSRRVDLYKDAFDALLKKWDASRGIRRSEVYRKLSPGRKEQLLARLAAQNFEASRYFVRQEVLTKQINYFLQELPSVDLSDDLDSDALLKAIEAQHGILVERAHGIYSFSHLTFQEYLVARYVVENAANGSVTRLVRHHLTDNRWHEVFLLTASMLDNADEFFYIFLKSALDVIKHDEVCVKVLRWANISKRPAPVHRAYFLYLALYREAASVPRSTSADVRALDLLCTLEPQIEQMKGLAYRGLSEAIARLLDVEHEVSYSPRRWNLTWAQTDLFAKYLYANQLLVECLRLAAVSDREDIEAQLLLSPSN